MAVGTKDASLAQALERHQMSYVKRGLTFGILSGMTWGLQGVLLWTFALALGVFMEPYFYSPLWAGLIAALACAALHDFLASCWIAFMCALTGRIREIGRTFRTKPGRLAIIGSIFGGPLGMGGYVMGMYLAGVTYALAISAIYPAIGALLGRIILKERINVRVWIGIFACLVGAVFVGWAPPEAATSGTLFYVGLACACGPAIGWAAEGVISTYGMDMIDPNIAIFIREFSSSVISLFVTVFAFSAIAASVTGGSEIFVLADGTQKTYAISAFTGFKLFFGTFTSASGLFWILVAAASGGFSYVFWYRGLNMIGTGRCMAFNVTYALWSVPFGYLANVIAIPVFGEMGTYAATLPVVIGVIMITIGAILVVVNPKELLHMRDV